MSMNLGAFHLKETNDDVNDTNDDNQSLSPLTRFANRKKQNDLDVVQPLSSLIKNNNINSNNATKIIRKRPIDKINDNKTNKKQIKDHSNVTNPLTPSLSSSSSQLPTTSLSQSISSSSSSSSSLKNKQKKKKISNENRRKNFDEIMSNVIIVISGIQNPERAEIREKAIEMGAKYKGDWDNSCTHLICAFVNTPKYNQVISYKGKIVTKNWILDSYKHKCLQPWRNYILGTYNIDSSDGDDDENNNNNNDKDDSDEEMREIDDKNDVNTDVKRNLKIKNESKYIIETDDEENNNGNDEIVNNDDKNNGKQINKDDEDNANDKDDNIYDKETESEDEENDYERLEKLKLPELPNFFNNKIFHLYGNFDDEMKRELKRIIIAYGGSIESKLTSVITHIISNDSWNEHFDKALTLNENILFVKPKWIQMCSEKKRFVPFQSYVIPYTD